VICGDEAARFCVMKVIKVTKEYFQTKDEKVYFFEQRNIC